jgi:hypothetical protein
MLLSQLLDPRVFSGLTTEDVDRLEAVVDAEILTNPEIQKVLRSKLERFTPHLKRGKK